MGKRTGPGSGKPHDGPILRSDVSAFTRKIRPGTPEAKNWPVTRQDTRPSEEARMQKFRKVLELVAQGISVEAAAEVEGTCERDTFWKILASRPELRREFIDAKKVGILRILEEAAIKAQQPMRITTEEVSSEDGKTKIIQTTRHDPKNQYWEPARWFASKLLPEYGDRQIHEGEVTIVGETSEARQLAQLLTPEELNALRARLADRFGDGGSRDPLPAA